MTGPDRSMFDVPVDAPYVWLGVATVSIAAFGVAVALPSATPPDATAVARAVDAVAVGPTGSQGSHELDAEQIELGRHRVGLAGPSGEAHASFSYGPVTPAFGDDRLRRVAGGERPRTVFDSRDGFAEAVGTARSREPAWRPAPDRLHVRRVSWGKVNATLVG